MRKVIGKTVLLALCLVVVTLITTTAQTPPPFDVSWLGISKPMPVEVYWHASAAYNGKIYVFGGNLGDAETNKTQIYDVSSGQWSLGKEMPTPRYLATAVEVDGKIYVMGGRQLVASGGPVNANECYDPATDTWTTKAAMPNAIRGHSAAAANGKIYVLGGNTGSYTDAVSVYDPSANTWSSGAKMPFKAAYGGATYVPSKGRIYWVGGVASSTPSAKNFIGKSASYDPAGNKWDSDTPAMKEGVAYNSVVADPTSGKVFAFSGEHWDPDHKGEYPYPYNQVLNTANNTWGFCEFSPSPIARSYGSCAYLDGKIYLVGGTQFNSTIVKQIDVYDPATNTWEDQNPIFPEIFSYNPAVAVINGKIYVVGGAWSSVNDGAWELDPSQPVAVKKSGIANVPRYGGVFGIYNDSIVVAEGSDNSGKLTGSAEIYTPSFDSFSPISGSDSTPTYAAAGAVVNGKLYVFGGYDGSNDLAKTRILDIESGTWSSGPDMPLSLEQASATALNNKIYIVGGYDGSSDNNAHDEIIIFDPATNTFSMGAKTPVAVLSPSITTYQNYIVVDGGTMPFESDGTIYYRPCDWLQFYDTSSDKWYAFPRLYGRGTGGCAMIGDKMYSLCGDDIIWFVDRVDIAQFGGGGCTLTCSASANPTSGAPPLTVNFTATANASGCTGTPEFHWNFGDGTDSTQQNPSHTYQNEGTYNWSLTVIVENQTCKKSGTVTVGAAVCTVTCNATATPTSGAPPLTVTFAATETHEGCTGTPTFSWDFGDNTTSTEQNTTHTYTTAGTYNWSLTVSVDGQPCSKTGTVTVTEVPPPQITSVKKATDPFRLVIVGSNFVSGCEVYIDGAKVPQTKFKSSTKVVAMKGAALKAMCPKGQTVKVTVKNPDGSVSNEYNYTR